MDQPWHSGVASCHVVSSAQRTEIDNSPSFASIALIAPDWSEFVGEELVVNLWTCTKCGDRFETTACMPDGEPKMSEKDWEQMFPPLWVA